MEPFCRWGLRRMRHKGKEQKLQGDWWYSIFAYGCVLVPASSPPRKCHQSLRLSVPPPYPNCSLETWVLSAPRACRSYRWHPHEGGEFCEKHHFLGAFVLWPFPADLWKHRVFGLCHGRFHSSSQLRTGSWGRWIPPHAQREAVLALNSHCSEDRNWERELGQ